MNMSKKISITLHPEHTSVDFLLCDSRGRELGCSGSVLITEDTTTAWGAQTPEEDARNMELADRIVRTINGYMVGEKAGGEAAIEG